MLQQTPSVYQAKDRCRYYSIWLTNQKTPTALRKPERCRGLIELQQLFFAFVENNVHQFKQDIFDTVTIIGLAGQNLDMRWKSQR